jgi:hypothetical protein
VPILISKSGATVKRRKRRNALRDRRPNDLRLAARPTRLTGTDASVTFRPPIPTPARRLNNICAETDVLQLPAAAGTFDCGGALVTPASAGNDGLKANIGIEPPTAPRAPATTNKNRTMIYGPRFEPAFTAISQSGCNALRAFPDALTFFHRRAIADFAVRERLPSIFGWKPYVGVPWFLQQRADEVIE